MTTSPWTAVPASLVAFATTVHVALLVLQHSRSHRRFRDLPPLIVSAALTASPWIAPSVAAVAAGVLLHVAWFALVERFAGPRATATVAVVVPAPALTATPVVAAPPRVGVRPAQPPSGGRASSAFMPTPVIAVHDETDTIRTFRLARPDHFTFEAGQFVTVQVRADGVPHVRCYSISSPPEASGYIEISVRRQGLVSSVLHGVGPGATLLVKPPAGRFTYPGGDDRPLVLVAGGIGITPLIGMLRHAVLCDPQRQARLLLSARAAADVPFRDELEHLVRRHRQVGVTVTITDDTRIDGYHRGRITADLLRDCAPDIRHSICLLCGPPGLIDRTRELLRDLQVPDAQVRFERFNAATAVGAAAAAPVASAEARGGLAQGEPAGTDGPSEGARAAAAARVTFARSQATVQVNRQTTLLEAAEGAGVSIPSMCRSGVCGTCRTRVTSGTASCTSDALDAGDRAEGFVLPCVAWPSGDCTVDA